MALRDIKWTYGTKQLFIAYAEDAGNWAGNPLVGGNVESSKELRGNLTQLKRLGLLTTFKSDGLAWVAFTDYGLEIINELGIEMRWL